MRAELYAVVEHNQASRQPDDQGVTLWWNLDEAVEQADSLTADNRAAGRSEQFRIFTLTEVDESELWEWGLRRAGSDAEPLRYIHEQAARRSRPNGDELLRRRRGAKEWKLTCGCLCFEVDEGVGDEECGRCGHDLMAHNEDTGTCWSVTDAAKNAIRGVTNE